MQFTTFIAFALAVAHVGVVTTGAFTIEARQAQCINKILCTAPSDCPSETPVCMIAGDVLGCSVGVSTTVAPVLTEN